MSKTQTASPEHEVTYQELVALFSRHPNLTPMEILAIAANAVGKIVAMQERTVTGPMAMQVVAINLEIGNQQALAEVMKSKGSA